MTPSMKLSNLRIRKQNQTTEDSCIRNHEGGPGFKGLQIHNDIEWWFTRFQTAVFQNSQGSNLITISDGVVIPKEIFSKILATRAFKQTTYKRQVHSLPAAFVKDLDECFVLRFGTSYWKSILPNPNNPMPRQKYVKLRNNI